MCSIEQLLEQIAGHAGRRSGLGFDRHAGQRHELRHAVHDRRQARDRSVAAARAPASTWCRRTTSRRSASAMQRGRALHRAGLALAPRRVAIVNDAFVRGTWTDVDPLTQRLVVEQLIPGVTRLGPGVEWQIVGVYRDVRNGGPRGDFPEIDVPFAQSPWPATSVAVRTRCRSGTRAREPRRRRSGARSRSADDGLHDDGSARARIARRRSVHGGVVWRLCAPWHCCSRRLASTASCRFSVAQRTHEIGLRMALGAEREQVLAPDPAGWHDDSLRRRAARLDRRLPRRPRDAGHVLRRQAIDPTAFSIVTGLLLACAILACLIPALRAASVDPMTALRQE